MQTGDIGGFKEEVEEVGPDFACLARLALQAGAVYMKPYCWTCAFFNTMHFKSVKNMKAIKQRPRSTSDSSVD